MSSSRNKKGITRRQWTRGCVAAMGTASAIGQTTKIPPQGAPAPAAAAATPEQKLAKAYSDVKKTSDRLSQIEVPIDVEPAFAFRA